MSDKEKDTALSKIAESIKRFEKNIEQYKNLFIMKQIILL